MVNFDDVFGKFIESKSRFFELPDGAEKTVTIINLEAVTTNFKGKEVNCLRYHLLVDGKEMMWDRSSRELATQMRQYKMGDVVRIKREGERNKTKYFVKKTKS